VDFELAVAGRIATLACSHSSLLACLYMIELEASRLSMHPFEFPPQLGYTFGVAIGHNIVSRITVTAVSNPASVCISPPTCIPASIDRPV
jgi:hypothetical protein